MNNIFYIVSAAVQNNGNALYFASDKLKNNYDIVLMAVINNGYALKSKTFLLIEDHEISFPELT